MDELKRCPFCGGTFIKAEWYGEPQAICDTCHICITLESDGNLFEAINRRADGWVSVEKRLPDEYKEVEITDGKNVEIGMYTNVPYPLGSVYEWDIDKIAHSEINLKKITHWKEKPQPPKEGE
mgnify:CR=1 FL=1